MVTLWIIYKSLVCIGMWIISFHFSVVSNWFDKVWCPFNDDGYNLYMIMSESCKFKKKLMIFLILSPLKNSTHACALQLSLYLLAEYNPHDCFVCLAVSKPFFLLQKTLSSTPLSWDIWVYVCVVCTNWPSLEIMYIGKNALKIL